MGKISSARILTSLEAGALQEEGASDHLLEKACHRIHFEASLEAFPPLALFSPPGLICEEAQFTCSTYLRDFEKPYPNG
jgi:hypothetical protein